MSRTEITRIKTFRIEPMQWMKGSLGTDQVFIIYLICTSLQGNYYLTIRSSWYILGIVENIPRATYGQVVISMYTRTYQINT